MKKLIRDSHKKLAKHYHDWSILLFYHHDILYGRKIQPLSGEIRMFNKFREIGDSYKPANSEEIIEESRKILEWLDEFHQFYEEFAKKMISEDYPPDPSLIESGKYKEIEEEAEYYFKECFKFEFDAVLFDHRPFPYKKNNFTIFESAGKEKAIAVNRVINKRENLIDFDHFNAFRNCAIEHKMLSIIYDNYEEVIQIMTELETDLNGYTAIEFYRDDVVRDSSELIKTWLEKTKRIKRSRIGGRQPLDKNGYYLAIREVLKKLGPNTSAQRVWDYFKRHHDKPSIDLNKKEPMYVEEYKIYFNRDELVQDLEGKRRQISRKVVGTYLTELRPVRKKKVSR